MLQYYKKSQIVLGNSIKLGGGQAYYRSSDLTAVVAGATNDRA
jgi:hypothetical protein